MRIEAAALLHPILLPPSARGRVGAFSSYSSYPTPPLFAARTPHFSVSPRNPVVVPSVALVSPRPPSVVLRAATGDDDDEDESEAEGGDDGGGRGRANPYADPNYPDLEFVDYSDPNYAVDQGVVGDEFFPSPAELAAASSSSSAASAAEGEEADDDDDDGTIERIEAMREDRRRRNDEFQFETYHAEVLRGGEPFMGEWTVYRTSTFLPGRGEGTGAGASDPSGAPELVRGGHIIRVVSRGRKVAVETESDWRVDGERIVHEETMEVDYDGDDDAAGEILSNRYWPEELSAYDFRGHQGIMCVGNAYTICDAVPLFDADTDGSAPSDAVDDPHAGPFREYRAEVGLQYKRMRFRIKLDYRAADLEEGGKEGPPSPDGPPPPLLLRSLTVCRETRARWPRHGPHRTDVEDESSSALFGPPGADGGLYDPPPVGSDVQASDYVLLDLEGGATVLLPHRMDQSRGAYGGNGWVTSLDWTPGRIRYQVDRKVGGGRDIKGLRTLELSEVEGASAGRWRPRDGPADMRQW